MNRWSYSNNMEVRRKSSATDPLITDVIEM